MRIVLLQGFAWALIASMGIAPLVAEAAPTWPYHVVATHPHDPAAFTEGLAIDGDQLIESTGRNGESMLIIRSLSTGKLVRFVRLDDRDFGEGVAVVGKEIVQLTWKSGVGYLYDFNLHRIGTFAIPTEGWGLAFDGRQFIRSDGSSNLRLLDPKSFHEDRRITVRDGSEPIERLNELEFVAGKIYANVWLTDRIAVIDSKNGRVIAWLDLSELKARFEKPLNWDPGDNVLNGIAYDPKTAHFWVTGKYWPVMYEIAIERPALRSRPQRSAH